MTPLTRAPKIGTLLTAMLTPFDRNGDVDLPTAARLARFLIDEGNEGLVVCGTTGESPALDDDEKLALFETVVEAVGARFIPQASRSTLQSSATSLAWASVEARLQQKLISASPLRLRRLAQLRVGAETPSMP